MAVEKVPGQRTSCVLEGSGRGIGCIPTVDLSRIANQAAADWFKNLAATENGKSFPGKRIGAHGTDEPTVSFWAAAQGSY